MGVWGGSPQESEAHLGPIRGRVSGLSLLSAYVLLILHNESATGNPSFDKLLFALVALLSKVAWIT